MRQTDPGFRLSPANPEDSGPNHELKFVFPNALATTIATWLSLRCLPDPEYPDGLVSSIYFDSRDLQCLAEKSNSDFLKMKVRWRWYSDPETGAPWPASFVEIKSKFGANRDKLRIPASRAGDWLSRASLLDPALLEVNHILLRHNLPQPRAWHPAFEVTYRRRRFIDPFTGGRLCVDSNIRAPRAHPPLDDLPAGLHQLTAMGCRRESFSKYLSCFLRLRGEG